MQSGSKESRATEKAQSPRLTLSVHDFGWIIPVAFIAIKLTRLPSPLSLEIADSIVGVLARAWPAARPQYDEFVRLELFNDAANYSLFYLCLFLLLAYFFQKILRASLAARARLRIASVKIMLAIVLCVGILYYAMFWDTVKPRPLPIYNFYIDPFGFYYLRQWALFSVASVMVLLVVPPLVTFWGHFRRAFRQSGNFKG
jgi:hypothetical protein